MSANSVEVPHPRATAPRLRRYIASSSMASGKGRSGVSPHAWINLYWLPLGAGGHSVRLNGRVFELMAAGLARRSRYDLYHSALEVEVPEGRFVIEQAPARCGSAERGVVGSGAVGARAAGRFRLFRYEIRCWLDGTIPDIAEAVESPRRLSDDLDCARRLRAGEMWNSNSLVSWLIASSGLDVESIALPRGGRAPGWRAGIVVARRQQGEAMVSRCEVAEDRVFDMERKA
jgi:hypothetical protein